VLPGQLTVRGQPVKLPLPQVSFVTGKGGTGKSTVAAALAIARVRGAPVLLIDLDRRASAIKAAGLRSNRSGDHPIELVAVTMRGELEKFIDRIVPIKTIARRMLQSRTFGFVTAALPGLEAFLMLERVRLLAKSHPDHLIVVDAPATGTALELLNAPAGIGRLAPVGTLHRLAAEVERFLQDKDSFGVLLTAQGKELALREAIAARDSLDQLGIRCTGAIVNQVEVALFTSAEIARLAELGGHQRLARDRQEAARAGRRAVRQLHDAGLQVVTLPMIYRAALAGPELATLADSLAGAIAR
jgi:anion-transporting  ArsA/GET3 family ATPase